MRKSPILPVLIASAASLWATSPAHGAVEWKLRLEGRIVSANSQVVRIRTARQEIVDVARHNVPRGFDLRPGKMIRWISPEYKERKPSGELSPGRDRK